MREFDLVKKEFIAPENGGFFLPEAKSDAVIFCAENLTWFQNFKLKYVSEFENFEIAQMIVRKLFI